MKITDYLAIYATLLSTFVFLWNIFQSRAKVKVDLMYGVESKGNTHRGGVYIIVRNTSSHAVHLAGCSILYRYGYPTIKEKLKHLFKYRRSPKRLGWVASSLSNYSIEDECPISLEARKSHRVFIPAETMNEIFEDKQYRTLIASVQDQLWQTAYSKPFSWK